ncbi:MAG: GMC oxidoreductase [Betaproteobacteria bacterium]|nr:GMC oxidoreductase [Betaproteobacteria bacterium]
MSSPSCDYLIVGAGSAGCALAARLTESGRHAVVLIEAGEDDPWVWIRIPTGIAKIVVGQRALWRFTTESEAGLGHRPLFWPRGKVFGGTSSVNGMFWVRGDPLEYDHWRDLGNPGWSYADLLPIFKRMESYAKGDPAVRGHAGPNIITESSPRDALTDAFLRACAQAGIAENPDYNSGHYDGAGLMQFTTRRGLRWGAREAYLRPAMRRANFRVIPRAHATRIHFDGRRADGITYRVGDQSHAIYVSREVIIAAGTVQSPQLLELSGIGDASLLAQHGIAVRHHLPGVGENLRDHLHARLMMEVRGLRTLNETLRSPWAKAKMALRWALFRDGMMSVPGVTAHAYVHTDPARRQPDIKLQLHHLTSPDERNPTRIVLDEMPGFSLGIVHQQPSSRGSIHIRSGDPIAAPEIRANYLSHPDDMQAFIRGMRMARQVVAQPALAPHIVRELRPGIAASTDATIADYLVKTIFSSYHPVGTCKMGHDPMAVVDAELRVHGVPGLRIADASVMPTIPASNTNAAAIVIGEKAADLLLASV